MTKRALVIVDLQNDYFPNGKWTLDGIEDAAENTAKLIAKFREAGEPVIHIRHEFPADGAPFFAEGSEGAKIHEKVQPIEGEPVVLKHQVNSFLETNLKEVLDDNKIEDLVICGAMSHMCIDATARAASDFGYKCTLIHDACATRAQEFNGMEVPAEQVHATYMASLGFAYAKVVSTDEFANE
ncbi:MAG: cysteine hydrolase [Candidatus Nitronauta litoralis]|uniref:Cysteine hydrolase n=1 Tax=Candidatus Nitronauta litoralis TaxID=2705533 RepID=A0A7T0FZD4_9BACT|nr:MAG: cysteine hydrolase [Candidatus Nitronauta litoralis]